MTIYNLDAGTTVVSAQAMTEVANGIYKYSFTTYDPTVNYAVYVDGTSTLADNDRYQYGDNSNEVWNMGTRTLTSGGSGSLAVITATYSDNHTDTFNVKTIT